MKMKRKIRFILCLVLVALLAVAAFSACKSKEIPSPEGDAIVLGTGANTLELSVTFADGHTDAYRIKTDEETVGAALLAHDLVAGDVTAYGLMITSVAGELADWDADGAYWAFYVDGEYALAGADSTPIEEGSSYAFVYTKG